jgi:hypothetical protein
VPVRRLPLTKGARGIFFTDHNFFASLRPVTAGRLCEKKKNKSRKDAKTPRPPAANKQKQEARNKSREVDYNFFAPVRGGGQVSASLREENLEKL